MYFSQEAFLIRNGQLASPKLGGSQPSGSLAFQPFRV